ncbi:hypothetical protein SYJ56_01990 [Algoriphagus sp. D3-2-R+10]|uniref:hypothetical protein n=1 Tax=Algoriphagus aurantiacus TaxID=3103948 RepID=UPI002B3DC79F|nr:hypothetical protein [Algoriphagus sp. D3-2-R+10]MEB2774056.1 hypothetical protein [Algoriphagus sp. D3-2-R+10]
MKTRILFLIAVFILHHELFAQNDSTLQTIQFDPKPSQILLSPILSANLIGSNQWEINIFNTLTTRNIENIRIQKRPFVDLYDTTITQNRFSYMENLIQIQHGIPGLSRLNFGVDFYFSHVRGDSDINSSPFRVFGNNTETGSTYRDFSAIGPRIRWIPFRKLPELTVQGSVVFGVNDSIRQTLYGRDRTQTLTQFTFYQRFRPWLYAFAQTDVSVYLKNDNYRNNTFSFPVFLFASANIWGLRSNAYPKLYALVSWSYASRYDDNIRGEDWLVKRSSESQIGVGLLSQWNPQWGVTLWTQKPIKYELGSASNTVIPKSWYSLSLGIRYVWSTKSNKQKQIQLQNDN